MSNRIYRRASLMIVTLLLLIAAARGVWAQGTVFTYQGQLKESGSAANGTYDLQFKLFDTPVVETGSQQGPTLIVPGVQVAGGIFTVQLDFGLSVFTGAIRYLEIGVRPAEGTAGNAQPFTVLSPRQPVTSTPYSIRSYSAAAADTALDAAQLGGMPPSGFIQNTTSAQAGANFNVAGNGTVGGALSAGATFNVAGDATVGGVLSAGANFNVAGDATVGGVLSANVVSAATQYNIGNNRVLKATVGNIFLGISAGQQNTGDSNTFVGGSAGTANLAGSNNSFFGTNAGFLNGAGSENSFFGSSAGFTNTGNRNSFFGTRAGQFTGFGNGNSFFGFEAGKNNTTGLSNTFVGASAGLSNTSESTNTFIGANANGASGISNATALGSSAQVTRSNSLVLGRVTDPVVNVGIGITAPTYKLHVIDPGNTGLRVQTDTNSGTVASFGGFGAFQIDAEGVVGGRLTVTQTGNVGIGTAAPTAKLHVIGNATISGNLSKGGGSFKIDHPLDPENKYLYHSFVESPDMKNVYDGVAVLNKSGEALVTLPSYFEALNRDFRYQLTAIGKPAPNIYIAREIKRNQFKIAGGKAGLKVSWQVTGIRKDAYANANRIAVEEDKPPQERGKLLHPDAFIREQ